MTKIALMAAIAFGLFTTQAFAKPAKEEQILSTGAPNWGSLKGLSAVVAFDTADEAKQKKGANFETDNSFAIGAQYEFSQFYPGVGWQVGGLYEFSKDVDNATDPNTQERATGAKYKNLTGYLELVGKVTPKLKIVGGLNYSSPDLSGVPDVKLKGDMGFQLGGTFAFNENFAIDARYRSLRMEMTRPDQLGGREKVDVKSEGLMFAGRYMF